MGKKAVIAITRHGIDIARRLRGKIPEFEIYAPDKFRDGNDDVNWYGDPSSLIIARLFQSYEGIVCIFSLGAVIRLIAPCMKDKKTDPAVVVIDDKAQFVISTLSGHLGGANSLTRLIASILNARPVITTAADVNETIAVDLLGREFGWVIDDDSTVTKTSAHMVNEDKIGIYQDIGEDNWWPKDRPLPKNVNIVNTIDELSYGHYNAALIITDKLLDSKYETLLRKSVIYRPKSLVVGIGLHWDTSKNDIMNGIQITLKNSNLSFKSVRNVATLKREAIVKGLQEFSTDFNIPVEYFDKDQLAAVETPNPSDVVKKFEGTASVSEASAMLSANSEMLIIHKQKFPPNLTVAVTRVKIN